LSKRGNRIDRRATKTSTTQLCSALRRHCARRGAWYFISRVAKAHREFSINDAAAGIIELGELAAIDSKISFIFSDPDRN